MTASIHVFAAPQASTPTLSSASIAGFTPDGGDDKDNDSQIKTTLFVDFGGGLVQTVASNNFEAHGRFPDGQSWGPIDIPVKGVFTIDDVAKLRGKIEFQPKGDDTWKFSYTLSLNFSDGRLIQKSGSNELSDQKREIPL
ncbi:MAG: hypothetical protein LAO78_27665 [Acidobacteriia bacterium]|nr:hypothetical protein [Terriglobia bacterium]